MANIIRSMQRYELVSTHSKLLPGNAPRIPFLMYRATPNPVFIPRNHLVEAAIAAAMDRDDLSVFHQLVDTLANPYEHRTEVVNDNHGLLLLYGAPMRAKFGAGSIRWPAL